MRTTWINSIILFAGILFIAFPLDITCQVVQDLKIGGLKRDLGSGLIIDSEGNIVITGTSRSYGNGGDDIFFIKMKLEGGLISQKTFPKEHHERAYGIEECLDGNYMIVGEAWDGGFGREDIYLLKLDKQGDKLWEKYYGGYHTDQGFDIKSLEDGYIALGYTSSQPETTRGNFYLVRTDLEGNMLWEKNFGTDYLDFGFSVLPSSSGDFYLLGTAGGFFNPARADFLNHDANLLLIRTNQNGFELSRKYMGGSQHDWGKDMFESDSGELYLFGSTQSIGAGSFDMYLTKVDASGHILWERTYGESDFEYGNAMSSDPEGNIFLTGTKKSPSLEMGPDIYVIKTNPEGEVLWEQTLGGLGSDYGYDIECLPDSGCVIVGEIENIETKFSDIYVARLDKDGEMVGFKIPQDSLRPEAVNFFPNPVVDKATIEWLGVPPPGGYRVLIFSISGQVLYSRSFESNKKIEFEIGKLPPGTYLYQIVYGKKNLSGKFMTR